MLIDSININNDDFNGRVAVNESEDGGLVIRVRRYGDAVQYVQSEATRWQHEEQAIPREVEITLDPHLRITNLRTLMS